MKNYLQRNYLQPSSLLALLLLTPIAIPLLPNPSQAQESSPSPSSILQIPENLPSGTKIRVDGDTSMKGLNALLKSKLEAKFSGSTVELAESTSTGALQALEEGKLDIAAIGRPLSESEKAKGFTELPVAFNKIGIFTSADNPFKASLTNAQFAKIFRGEITNWSEVGGPDAPIVLIDRPDSSDTRVSFARYPVFQAAPFNAATSATKIETDTNDAVIEKLGKTGIGYALAEQVMGKSDLTIIPLHKVLPDDPRYSFSQPLTYVYKTLTPGVQAFLGLAQDPSNLQEIETVRKSIATGAKPSVTAAALNAPTNPTPTTAPTDPTAPPDGTTASSSSDSAMAPTAIAQAPIDNGSATPGSNWWLLPLLGLPLLGAAAYLLRPKAAPIAPVVAPVVPLAGAALAGAGALKSRLIAVPRDCRNGYAYWELDEAQARDIRSQGKGQKLAMRLYDVTVDDLKRPDRSQFTQVDLKEGDTDCHFVIPQDDRDYMAELGYLNAHNEWHRVATSDVVHGPSCTLEPEPSQTLLPRTIAPSEPSLNEVGLPDMTVPDINVSAIDAPDISAPEIGLPNLPNLPNLGNLGGVVAGGAAIAGAAAAGMMAKARTETPDISSPEINLPEVNAPNLDLPNLNLPEVNAPNLDLPNLNLPEVNAPNLDRPDVNLPEVTAPNLTMPDMNPLDMNRPEVSLPEVNLPEMTTPEPQLPDVNASNLMELAPNLPTFDPSNLSGSAIAGGAALTGLTAMAGLGAVGMNRSTESSDRSHDDPTRSSSEIRTDEIRADEITETGPKASHIILVPKDKQSAYAYWEINPEDRDRVLQQGGQQFVLRVSDAHGHPLDGINQQSINQLNFNQHSFRQYDLTAESSDYHFHLPALDRDYIAEVGYLTRDQRWISLARSTPVLCPSTPPSA